MTSERLVSRGSAVAVIVCCAAAFRLVPHLPNVTPILAMALFGGARFERRRDAVFIVLAAMFLSDLILGFDVTSPFVYSAIAASVFVGWAMRARWSLMLVGVLGSSAFFFLWTNFGVWLTQEFYPLTFSGLVACYTAAIPFFRNALVGDLCYSAVLFGGFAALEAALPKLRKERLSEA